MLLPDWNRLSTLNLPDRNLLLSLKAVSDGETTLKAFDADTTSHVIGFLYGAIDGVQCYDRAFPTAVESSLNTGIVETTEDTVKIKIPGSSSVATKLDDMRNKLDLATDLAGASREISGEYPAWSYNAGFRDPSESN